MTDDKRKTHLIVTGRGGGSEQVQADWSQTDSEQPDYIKNKPTILTQWFGTQAEYDLIDPKDPNTVYHIEGGEPLQSDWNQSDNTQVDYIKNKPTIPTVPAMGIETLTFTLQGGTTKTIDFYTVPNYFYVEDISGSNNRLSITKSNEDTPTIEVFCSTNTVNWTSMGNTDTTAITATVPANGKLYLKANTFLWGGGAWGYGGNEMTCSRNYNVGGNIMSLLNGDNFEGTRFPDKGRQFQRLFQGSTTLVNAKDIVFPNNTNYACYRGMFNGCTSLVSVSAYADAYDGNGFDGWLNNVSATGDFFNLGGATFPSGGSGIPTGWTEHTSL
jgi:hypothetical protein